MSQEQRLDDLEIETKVRRFVMYMAVFGVSVLLLCVAAIGVGYLQLNAQLKAREAIGDHRWCALVQTSLAEKPLPGQSPQDIARNRALVTQLGKSLGCIK